MLRDVIYIPKISIKFCSRVEFVNLFLPSWVFQAPWSVYVCFSLVTMCTLRVFQRYDLFRLNDSKMLWSPAFLLFAFFFVQKFWNFLCPFVKHLTFILATVLYILLLSVSFYFSTFGDKLCFHLWNSRRSKRYAMTKEPYLVGSY